MDKDKNKYHDADKCVNYLLVHPVTRSNERTFLIEEEKKVGGIINEANQEKMLPKNRIKLLGGTLKIQ